MAYVPPAITGIIFELTVGYTAPPITSVDFTIGGATTTSVDCVNAPLQSVGDFAASVTWTYPLLQIVSANSLAPPVILTTLFAPAFVVTSAFTGKPQPRVSLEPFGQVSRLTVQGVADVPQDIEVVSPWPFEAVSALYMGGVATTITRGAMVVGSSLEVPSILAGGAMAVDVPSLFCNAACTADIMPIINLIPLESTCGLSVYAIKTMPTGDQYLACTPFETQVLLSTPVPVFGYSVPAFQSNLSLSAPTIHYGGIATLEPLQVTPVLSASVSATLGLQPFDSTSSLAQDFSVNIIVVPGPIESDLTLDIDGILISKFVEIEPLQMRSTMRLNTRLSVHILENLSTNSNLINPYIVRAVVCPYLHATGSVDVGSIRLFNLDNTSQFYHFVLTGKDDIEIPISSFQARRRNGESSFLQVVIPTLDNAAEINARSNGTLQVYLTYKLAGVILRQELIIDAPLSSIRLDEGPLSSSITLSGYKTETFTSKSITLSGALYKSVTDGKIRYRLANPSLDLTPGDEVTIGTDTFTADLISYYYRATKHGMDQNMEISEA